MARNKPRLEIRGGTHAPLGMPAARFLREYWQKRPLLVRGAFPAWRNPVEPDDLAGLACEELSLARIAIHDPKHDRWTLRTGPFAEADFSSLPATHWTLLVQDVDKWDADVAALLAPFAFIPSWRIDDVMISYAEEGGSVGPHIDQYDVFLIQGLGNRRWQIDVDPGAPTAFRDDAELRILREFAPSHEWTLEPGDMLYLPPGVPHHGVAVGGPCMTYSVGMRAPSQADLLGDLVDHLLETLPDEARYADPDLAPAKGDGEIDDAAIARVVRALPWLHVEPASAPARVNAAGIADACDHDATGGSAAIPASLLRAWLGRFITRYRSAHAAAAPARPIGNAAFARAAAARTLLGRNPWSRFAWMREGRAARLFVAGEMHECTVALARALCGPEPIPLAGSPRELALLRTLLDAGHLALLRPACARRPR